MEFQAKDIQRIVGIPKHRYEYIATRIGIKPDVAEVDGTGRSHVYSFKNLLEFAFAHKGSNLGLSPKLVRAMLKFVSTNPDILKAGIMHPGKRVHISIHVIEIENQRYFKLSGKDLPAKTKRGYFSGQDFEVFTIPKIDNTWLGLMALSQAVGQASWGDMADGYITINLGTIRDRVAIALAALLKG